MYEKWQAKGEPEARQLLREKNQDMIREIPALLDFEELLGIGN